MLKGNLSQFPLGTLIQTLAVAGRSGVLVVSPPWIKGRITLRGGALHSAKAGARSGWEAIELLAGLTHAPFVFDDSLPMTDRANIKVPLETALARMMSVGDRWSALRHLPGDWQLELVLQRKPRGLRLTPAMLQVLALAEGRTVARVIEEAAVSPIAAAEALDQLLADGVLELSTSREMGLVTLVALSFYGNRLGVAYIDEDLHQEWTKLLPGVFGVRVSSPHGIEASFEARPRVGIPGRVMLHDKDLRRLRAGRGVKLSVRPELLNRSGGEAT